MAEELATQIAADNPQLQHALQRRRLGIGDKSVRTIITPEGAQLTVHIASAGHRILAIALDFVFLFIFFYLIITAMQMAQSFYFTSPEEIGVFSEIIFGFFILLLYMLRILYFLVLEMGSRSATFGKRIARIHVAARDGGRLTAEAIVARNLIREIELFLPVMFLLVALGSGKFTAFSGWATGAWLLLLLLFPLFNKDRLRAGDVVAGTWVVMREKVELGDVLSDEARLELRLTSNDEGYQFSEADLDIYGEFELQFLEKLLRTNNDEKIVSAYQAICRKLGWEAGEGDERAFVSAYYTQLRARLEHNMRFGQRRLDKYDD